MKIKFDTNVQDAIKYIRRAFPEVTQVFFGKDGSPFFCDDKFKSPNFTGLYLDQNLLKLASISAEKHSGLPCGFSFYDLHDFYALFEEFKRVPVFGKDDQDEDGNSRANKISRSFLHFECDTDVSTIYSWFIEQHPDFQLKFAITGH